jgi:hypothetical protein
MSWLQKHGKTKMSQPERVSTLSWQWPLLLSLVLLALVNMYGLAPLEDFVSFDLIIAGGGILLTGLLLKFVVLRRAEPDLDGDPYRSVVWQKALAGPFALLGSLIASLGVALLIVPNDLRPINITWAAFALFILVVLGTIMARALRVFSGAR